MLWGKLSTEDKIQPLTGHVVRSPICGADKDNLHFFFHCSPIKVADCIDKALDYIDLHGISHSILQFTSTHEGETLATMLGKVLWTARQAMWVTRCFFRFHALPDTRRYHTFLSVWAKKLKELANWPGAGSFSSYFRSIRHAILELLNTGTLVPRIFVGDWFFTLQSSQRSKRRKVNKETRLATALAELQPYLSGDWVVFYADGSCVRTDVVGWVGGFGVYCPQLRIKHAMPNPEGERQTNHAAEPLAVLWVLEHFTTGKIVIALDSKIVNEAIKGRVLKWKDNGWRCLIGPLGNVHCWAALSQLLNMPGRELRTILLPSHCDIIGNEVANDLAELGRSRNPLNATHTDGMQCRAEILNETPLSGRQRPCAGSNGTPAQTDFDTYFYIDVDLGAD